MNRVCGDCQLCCKLLPIDALSKPANKRCRYQKIRTGCTIYSTRPAECRVWSCQWLKNPETNALKRPDRAHYVIDPIPDYVRFPQIDGSDDVVIPVLQIWIDPGFPDAHRDPSLRAFLAQVARRDGMAALIRFDERTAITLLAPFLHNGPDWIEITGEREAMHSVADIFHKLQEHSKQWAR